MERVAFLVETSGERLGCLLNPESLHVARRAGVRRRRAATGLLTGAGISDDPLLYTGGGETSLQLDLLFDLGVGGSTIQATDVRDLTRPLWDLAESTQASGAGALPPVVRFLWGKTWNLPGVVTAVAERLEHFGADGAPARSWLRMRLTRVSEDDAQAVTSSQLAPPADAMAGAGGVGQGVGEGEVVHQVLGGGSDTAGTGERLEDIAFQYYGDPSAWRLIADLNGIADPGRVAPGTLLRIPPSPTAGGGL
jgi:hypothetical protein